MAGGQPVVKVLVLGNSVCRMIVPERTSRRDATFAQLLERDPGVSVENSSRWYELLDEGSERYRFELRSTMPDVLVLNYGSAECQPAVMPTWLNRHLTTWDQGLGPVASLYRKHLVPRVWGPLREAQRRLSALACTRTWRTPPHRFAATLTQLITTARHDKVVVLVLDVLPFGPRMEHFMPGLAQRREIFQQVLADVVASFDDPDVRLVPASSCAEVLGPDEAVPDGLHLSAAGHRHVAELLAAELRAGSAALSH